MAEITPDRVPDEAARARPLEALLADVEAATATLAAGLGPEILDGWDAPEWSRLVEAHGRIRAVSGRLDGVRYTLLPRIEDAGHWRSDGMSRTFSTWLKVHEGVGATTARKDVSTARRLAEALPATRAQLVSGDLGLDHAKVMADVTPTSTGRTDALGWLIDSRTGHVVDPEEFVRETIQGESGQSEFDQSASEQVSVALPELDPVAVDRVLTAAIDGGVLVTGERALLAEAPRLDADRFRKAAAAFAALVDPDQSEKDTDKAKNGEFLELSKTFGGFHLAGFLTDEHGRLVQTAIQTVLGPPQVGDDRTPAQRRAGGLADVARALLDNGDIGTGAAVRPHLNVTVSFSELVTQLSRTRTGACTTCGAQTGSRGSAATPLGSRPADHPLVPTPPSPTGRSVLEPGVGIFTDSGDPVPASLLKRLACDAQVTRIVFGPVGSVLDVGRAQRTVTGQMRRAVIARDKHCVYPACDQPPSRCEVHHAITHWADGGETSVHNSALLCHHHHDLVDSRGITMRWSGKVGNDRARSVAGAETQSGVGGQGVLVSTGWTFTDQRGREIKVPARIPTANGENDQSARRAA